MKYLKTLNIWDEGIQQAVLSGQLKLQVGQWLRCGKNEKPCRYVSNTTKTINVVHWQGSSKDTTDLFNKRLEKAIVRYKGYTITKSSNGFNINSSKKGVGSANTVKEAKAVINRWLKGLLF